MRRERARNDAAKLLCIYTPGAASHQFSATLPRVTRKLISRSILRGESGVGKTELARTIRPHVEGDDGCEFVVYDDGSG